MLDLVTISPKFQVVIPKSMREELGLRPGQRVHVMAHHGRIELIPIPPSDVVSRLSVPRRTSPAERQTQA